MSHFDQYDDGGFLDQFGLSDLELKLLAQEETTLTPHQRTEQVLLNPVHLDIWVNAKPDTLH